VAFSPDGKRLATTSADGTALLHALDGPNVDAALIRVIHNSEEPEIQASAVAFHPSLPEWVTGGFDGRLQLWDFAGKNLGKILHTDAKPQETDAKPQEQPRFIHVRFSPDGSEIAALALNWVYFWPLAGSGVPQEAGKSVRVKGVGSCDSIEYSRDGRRLAIACADGGIRIYDATARTLLKTITVHKDAVSNAAFSPDGTGLATASLDKTFHILPLRFEDLYFQTTRLNDAMSDDKESLRNLPPKTPVCER
jgi:WD40 repeat protein